ncbi:MAG: paraquat-inducible protein A [Planctomycetes bacterium]|nr:paraquat-inducible protein A [Planctomycetota bacterium]
MSATTAAPRPLPFARAALWACFPALGVGLFAPAVVASSDLGVVSEVARALGAVDGPRTLSIASSARKLLDGGHTVLAAVVVVTTFLVPVAKLLALDYGVRTLRAGGEGARRALSVAGELGRFAFLEVLVVALLLAVQTSGRFGMRLELRFGFHVFTACAATTLVLAVLVERALRRARAAAPPP